MSPTDPVTLGLKVIGLLDSANYSSTYKFATLLGLIEVIRESASADGSLTNAVAGTDIAEKVFETYWHQSVPYQGEDNHQIAYLRQSPQRDIPKVISEYRSEKKSFARSTTLADAESKDPAGIESLRLDVHQRVLKMPIPRLQKMGSKDKWTEDRFLFDYGWEEDKMPKDDTLHLKDGVALGLMQVLPLLRPYIESLWTNYVADRNPDLTDAADLRRALFGAIRTDTEPLRQPLRDIQNGLCFYCEMEIKGKGDVDHFLPYAHFTNEDLDNFVLSCSKCNNSKSDSLPSLKHLKKLLDRNKHCPTLDALAKALVWPRKTLKVISIAITGYSSALGANLWLSPGVYEDFDSADVQSVLEGFSVNEEN